MFRVFLAALLFASADAMAGRPKISVARGGAKAAVKSSKTATASPVEYSASIPFAPKPAKLDGTLLGDIGFDPLGLSNLWDIKWLRAAEIKHGRVGMLAATGFLVQVCAWRPARVRPRAAARTGASLRQRAERGAGRSRYDVPISRLRSPNDPARPLFLPTTFRLPSPPPPPPLRLCAHTLCRRATACRARRATRSSSRRRRPRSRRFRRRRPSALRRSSR